MKTDNDNETRLYSLAIFKCSNCGTRAVPLDGPGTDCHECQGTFDEKTPGRQTYELTEREASDIDDSVISEV